MALTGGEWVGIIAAAGVIGAAWVTGYFASRSAKSSAKDARESTAFDQSFQMTKYIRDEVNRAVAEETKDLRTKVANLERVVDSLYGKYTLIRDAFRDFFRATRLRLGHDTPPLDGRIRELIEDNEEDTITGAMLRELKESIRVEDEAPDAPPPTA